LSFLKTFWHFLKGCIIAFFRYPVISLFTLLLWRLPIHLNAHHSCKFSSFVFHFLKTSTEKLWKCIKSSLLIRCYRILRIIKLHYSIWGAIFSFQCTNHYVFNYLDSLWIIYFIYETKITAWSEIIYQSYLLILKNNSSYSCTGWELNYVIWC